MGQRLIDATILHDHIAAVFDTLANHGQMPDKELILMCIDNAPTVDPVKSGTWVREEDAYAQWYCNQCYHHEAEDDPDLLPNYCSNCGAKMDGDGHG